MLWLEMKGKFCIVNPFKNTHEEQIKLVNSFDWLDISKLNEIDEEFRELVRDSLFIDTARCDAICKALKQRISSLESLINDTARRFFVWVFQLLIKHTSFQIRCVWFYIP